MSKQIEFEYLATDIQKIAEQQGRVAILVDDEGRMDVAARRVNKLTRGAVARFIDSAHFQKMQQGEVFTLALPTGMQAEAVDILRLSRRADIEEARKGGANLARKRADQDLLLMAGNAKHAAQIAFGLAMRDYKFTDHKSKKDETPTGKISLMCGKPEDVKAAMLPLMAVLEGTFMTRDLINEPANVLSTTEFANRLLAMQDLGLKVQVLEEDELEALGMGALLCVGQGSQSPSKVVVMEWQGGARDEAPLALVGKGVVFDTGGISLKAAAGMEDMTMDMGGAGVVAGTMRALALRAAKANVVGLVGLVENMPSGNATRPGDVVTSMKGDTIEVINTDAEGRLVLADVMWYAQERFAPRAMIDLATLTGAIIVGLGHEKAGVFSNDDAFCKDFLKAAAAECEGAWHMPLGKNYDKLLKSRIADMKNTGGRPAGSITAAQFLQRFVKEDCPWIHLDIAGVASVKSETALAPAGATGWGVMSLNRLVCDMLESA